MIEKLKAFLYKREQNKKKRIVVKFLNNVKRNSILFNYKIADTYFHLYIKGRTFNLSLFYVYEVELIIEIVCFYLVESRLKIRKEFFKGIK